jgi:hypothetical protein
MYRLVALSPALSAQHSSQRILPPTSKRHHPPTGSTSIVIQD